MQRLFASTCALASDGSSACIAEPLHEAEEDHATIRIVFEDSYYINEKISQRVGGDGRNCRLLLHFRLVVFN